MEEKVVTENNDEGVERVLFPCGGIKSLGRSSYSGGLNRAPTDRKERKNDAVCGNSQKVPGLITRASTERVTKV